MVKQLSVFLENSPGRLAKVTAVLGEAGIDLLALSMADTASFGVLRAIASDTDRATAILKQAGYTVSAADVLAVLVPDAPGGLARALATLDQAGVNVEYIYSFVRKTQGQALILFKVDQPDAAAQALASQGLVMLEHDQILAL